VIVLLVCHNVTRFVTCVGGNGAVMITILSAIVLSVHLPVYTAYTRLAERSQSGCGMAAHT